MHACAQHCTQLKRVQSICLALRRGALAARACELDWMQACRSVPGHPREFTCVRSRFHGCLRQRLVASTLLVAASMCATRLRAVADPTSRSDSSKASLADLRIM